MIPSRQIRRHSGHTLVELIAAMVAGSMLLVGLGAVMFIARQVAYTPAASSKRVDAARAVNEMADEMRFATFFVTHTLHAVEFVVADRNNDGSAERIRYEWSGTVGDPLIKSVNGATPFAVVDSVQDFQYSLTIASQNTTLTTTTDSAESILLSNATIQNGTDRDITATSYDAQPINPAAFASVPTNALAWNATKVDFYGRQEGSVSGQVLHVQLRPTGDPADSPTSNVLGDVSIPKSSLTTNESWNTATFPAPVRGLELCRRYAVVWAGTADKSARLRPNDNASSGVLESEDAGASWQFMPTRQMFYRLYGTYTTPGSTYNITRYFASRAAVVLQANNRPDARINASIPLVTTPELLTGYWRTDFDTDPTALDVTRDGTKDWATSNAAAFNTATLVGGVWQANVGLQSRPLNNFTTLTTIETRCRNTSVGGNGAVLQFNGDRQGGVYGPLFMYLQLQSDGTQTVTLYGRSNDTTYVSLFQRKSLPSGFQRFRLTVAPQYHVVNLLINDEDQGTFMYPRYAPSANDGYVTAYNNTSNAEFDYVETRVSE